MFCNDILQSVSAPLFIILRTILESELINAAKFHAELRNALKNYCDLLRVSEWEAEVLMNFRKKMEAVVKNCKG